MASTVIDVHTHCLTEAWFGLLQQHGAPRYSVEPVRGGLRAIHLDGAPFMTPVPAMFDYDLRLKTMNEHGVDVCIVSLTCPNCYWGGRDVSLEAARIMNDDMAAARTAYRGRIEWFASLPWQYPDLALIELDRALAAGARGVMVLANIDGQPLTAPRSRRSGGRSTRKPCPCSCIRPRLPEWRPWTCSVSSSQRRSDSPSTRRSR